MFDIVHHCAIRSMLSLQLHKRGCGPARAMSPSLGKPILRRQGGRALVLYQMRKARFRGLERVSTLRDVTSPSQGFGIAERSADYLARERGTRVKQGTQPVVLCHWPCSHSHHIGRSHRLLCAGHSEHGAGHTRCSARQPRDRTEERHIHCLLMNTTAPSAASPTRQVSTWTAWWSPSDPRTAPGLYL